jgi:hypothetical protein
MLNSFLRRVNFPSPLSAFVEKVSFGEEVLSFAAFLKIVSSAYDINL